MLDGIVAIYKEKGYTSNDVVVRLRGILKMKKTGHTGTLDPDAEGVLPVCVGNGTGICSLIENTEKEYLAVMRLGVRTDTQDMSGTILDTAEQTAVEALTKEEILGCAASFVGPYDQVPPMYSALKVDGKRLYELAREGKTVERKARRVEILSLEVEKIELPLVTMRVRCSKGTYIRTLCDDIGTKLGVGAAMESLLRTKVGQFTLEDCVRLDVLQEIRNTDPRNDAPQKTEEAFRQFIMPVDIFFSASPSAVVGKEGMRFLLNGNNIRMKQVSGKFSPGEDRVRMYDEDGTFYAIYRHDAESGELRPVKMFLPRR